MSTVYDNAPAQINFKMKTKNDRITFQERFRDLLNADVPQIDPSLLQSRKFSPLRKQEKDADNSEGAGTLKNFE